MESGKRKKNAEKVKEKKKVKIDKYYKGNK